MSKVLNGGCHVFKRRRGRGKGGKGGKIALVVAVRQATDCSGWLALTPPRRETFKWHSACYNYRLRARERELSNAASMLNLGNTNKSRGSLPPPKSEWLNARDTKATKIPLVAYLLPDGSRKIGIHEYD